MPPTLPVEPRTRDGAAAGRPELLLFALFAGPVTPRLTLPFVSGLELLFSCFPFRLVLFSGDELSARGARRVRDERLLRSAVAVASTPLRASAPLRWLGW